MGESVFIIKATYSTAEKATAAADLLRTFLKQAMEAYDFWQRSRDHPKPAAKEFWADFKGKFPLIVEMLNHLNEPTPTVDMKEWSNGLAGKLGVIGGEEDVSHVIVKGKEVRYSAEVWHFSQWDHFARWILAATGADEVRWHSSQSEPDDWEAVKPLTEVKAS
jgi:hypothetical protein